MEENQQDLKIEDNQAAVKNLLNKPNEDADIASDPDGNKKSDEEKDSPDSPENKPETDASESNGGASPARKSPEPSCAICLEQLQNKSFTDSCFHMFCFTCLVEWSKVKAECPLCKQRFKSIVHNVRSIEDYDQYYIKSKSTENIWSCFGPDRRFHRYSTTMTSERYLERSRDTIESQMASHRMRFAPHAVRLYTQSQIVRMPCNFRRRIYDEHLWVKTFTRDRVRFISPEFYRGNPGCTHRLLPWLNRELVALLQNNETQVTFVMELIMALITRYEITSQEFFLHVEPYLSTHTNHFVHEFYNFAISPYDMEHYDRVAVYSNCYDSNRIHGVSSPDNDVIPISSNTPRVTPHVRFEQRELSSHRKQLEAFSHLKKLILKRNSQNNSWENVTASLTTSNGYSSTSSQLIFPIAGPSTSRVIDLSLTEASNSVSRDTHDVDSDDDDCQIIDVVKPKNERTPEIVDILSSDEEKVDESTEKVIEVSSDDDGYSSTASANRYAAAAPNVSDKASSNDNDMSSDVECVYENENFHASVQKSLEKIVKYLEPHPRPELVKVRSGLALVSTDNETSSVSLSPQRKQKRNISSSSHADDNSTGNCSAAVDSSDWGEYSDKNHKKKKLKLKSVVAHFSYDHEHHDSNHHSSHKRHKDKKKKKKKHAHKHKRRIYSDESD